MSSIEFAIGTDKYQSDPARIRFKLKAYSRGSVTFETHCVAGAAAWWEDFVDKVDLKTRWGIINDVISFIASHDTCIKSTFMNIILNSYPTTSTTSYREIPTITFRNNAFDNFFIYRNIL